MADDKHYGVTFDLWRTLIGEQDGSAVSPLRNARREERVESVLKKHGIAVGKYRIREALNEVARKIHEDHAEGADMLFPERVLQLLKLIREGATGTVQTLSEACLVELHAAIDNVFIEAPPQILPGALDLVKGAKELNLRLGIISNTGFTSPKAYHRLLDSAGMAEILDYIVLSNHVSAAKPNPVIFQKALQGLGLEAQNTIHVGDDPNTDVKGASEAGMATVYLAKSDAPAPSVMPNFKVSNLYEVLPNLEKWLAS